MFRIQPTKIPLIIKTLLWIYFSLAINSCTLTNKEPEVTTSIQNDSVLSWVEQGRNTEFPKEERAKFLEKALKAAEVSEPDSLKNIYYSRLSFAYLKLEDSQQFRTINQKSLALARKAKDTLTEAYAHWDLAYFFDNIVVRDSAFFHYSEAQKLF